MLSLKVDGSRQLQSENSIVEITVCSPPVEFSVVFCFFSSLVCFAFSHCQVGGRVHYNCDRTLYKAAFIFSTLLLTPQVSPKILHALGLESDNL